MNGLRFLLGRSANDSNFKAKGLTKFHSNMTYPNVYQALTFHNISLGYTQWFQHREVELQHQGASCQENGLQSGGELPQSQNSRRRFWSHHRKLRYRLKQAEGSNSPGPAGNCRMSCTSPLWHQLQLCHPLWNLSHYSQLLSPRQQFHAWNIQIQASKSGVLACTCPTLTIDIITTQDITSEIKEKLESNSYPGTRG